MGEEPLVRLDERFGTPTVSQAHRCTTAPRSSRRSRANHSDKNATGNTAREMGRTITARAPVWKMRFG